MIQVLFISYIPIDLFHKLLHIPESMYIFYPNKLRSLNAVDINEMSHVSYLQLPEKIIVVSSFCAYLQLGEFYLAYVKLLPYVSSSFHAIQIDERSIKTRYIIRCIISIKLLTRRLYFINYLTF